MPQNIPQIAIYDIKTGENIVRDMTTEEIAQHELDQAQFASTEKARLDKIAARETILEKLGLTADEAKLLLG